MNYSVATLFLFGSSGKMSTELAGSMRPASPGAVANLSRLLPT